jgi:hypothetical protein
MTERLDGVAAAQFLARACDRHGGFDAFAATASVSLRLVTLSGLIPWFKGLGRTFPPPSAVELWPHSRRARFHDYPQRGQVSVYQSGRVATNRDELDGHLGESHRATFRGLAKWRAWQPEDALYFFGYSLLDYVSLPFMLRDRELIDARRTRAGVELWYRFPQGADTHSSVQGFYFDESGLLVRHDYRAEILGKIFNGAHLHRDHRAVGNLLLPTHRTVYAKLWHYPVRARTCIPVLDARLAR